MRRFRAAITGEGAHRFLVHDRDAIYAPAVDAAVEAMGPRVLKTPARTLQANAFCERLIGTMRRECLGWLIPLHERHLRRILQEWFGHDNRGRPHTSLGPGLPEPSPDRGGQNRSGADSPHDIASWRRRFSAGCITNIDWSVRRDRQNAGVFCFCGALLISHPDLSHGTRYRVTTGVPVRHSLCVLSVKVACGLLLGSRFGSSLQPQGSVRPYGTIHQKRNANEYTRPIFDKSSVVETCWPFWSWRSKMLSDGPNSYCSPADPTTCGVRPLIPTVHFCKLILVKYVSFGPTGAMRLIRFGGRFSYAA